MDLEKLNRIIRNCKKCNLWKTRTNAVPGEGNPTAKIFFCGQAPGSNENKQGRPFVGMAGKFLDKLFNLIGLNRKEVFITGSVKCFPPKNRKPTQEELDACKPYLLTQLQIIKPKIIVLLGEVALKTLLNLKEVSKLHGKPIEKDGVIYFPTYHPAAGMRFPKIREKSIKDFNKLRELLKRVV